MPFPSECAFSRETEIAIQHECSQEALRHAIIEPLLLCDEGLEHLRLDKGVTSGGGGIIFTRLNYDGWLYSKA